MSDLPLTNLVSIVTGAGQGIGREIAKAFAKAGSRVLIATRSESDGYQTLDLLRSSGGEAHLLTVDLGSRDASVATVDAALKHFGALDIVVHNAASFRRQRIEAVDDDALDNVLAVNLKSAFWLTQTALPHLRKSKQARLLFTSSVTGPRTAIEGLAAYGSSKAGLNGFIRAAALEFAAEGITVNGVEPGLILTRALENQRDEAQLARMAASIPTKSLGRPEDIAATMLFLASQGARYITGQTIVVDGGASLVENTDV